MHNLAHHHNQHVTTAAAVYTMIPQVPLELLAREQGAIDHQARGEEDDSTNTSASLQTIRIT
jgi:hypothetical protein